MAHVNTSCNSNSVKLLVLVFNRSYVNWLFTLVLLMCWLYLHSIFKAAASKNVWFFEIMQTLKRFGWISGSFKTLWSCCLIVTFTLLLLFSYNVSTVSQINTWKLILTASMTIVTIIRFDICFNVNTFR